MIVPERETASDDQRTIVPERETAADDQRTAAPGRETAADDQGIIMPQREAAPAEEEYEERHDDDFEPMETPLAIPGTATVADGSRVIDTMYCLQGLCSLIPRKNMALFHNALTCIFEQKDGDEIYAAVKTRPELHTQLWSRYE